MKFFDTFTIVTKDYADLNISDPPLAYMLPGDLSKNSKTDQAKRDSAHTWASYYNSIKNNRTEHNFNNTPMRGFRIGDVTKRYSTSNKFFRIIDPRGFELEISTENLNELLQKGMVNNGVILGEHVWCKHNRDYLCPVHHPEYEKYILPPEQKVQPELKPR